MIPAVIALVEDKLTHSREIVRKKAVLCIHRFLQKAPSSVMHIMSKIRKALCDQVRMALPLSSSCPLELPPGATPTHPHAVPLHYRTLG